MTKACLSLWALALLSAPPAGGAGIGTAARIGTATEVSAAPRPEQDMSPEKIRAAWARLTPAEKSEVAEWFRHELRLLPSYQNDVLRRVLAKQERDPGLWPRFAPPPYYDPATHAPGARPMVPRKPLAATDSRAAKEQKRMLAWRPARLLHPAYRYDWGRRELVALGGDDDPDRVFENAMLGAAPEVDLAIALMTRKLDLGHEQVALAAFGHAYTDRTGWIYPGITLYDAWCSGEELEMPDVDALGIAHEVLNEWTKWKAPVPNNQHEKLYRALAEVFVRARRYRGVREALAETALRGNPGLVDGYEVHVDRLHALWLYHEQEPQRVAATLPDSAGTTEFLATWTETAERTPALMAAGRERRRQLELSETQVRATLQRVMEEFGAFRPRPKSTAKAGD